MDEINFQEIKKVIIKYNNLLKDLVLKEEKRLFETIVTTDKFPNFYAKLLDDQYGPIIQIFPRNNKYYEIVKENENFKLKNEKSCSIDIVNEFNNFIEFVSENKFDIQINNWWNYEC